jgi:DHA2 family metal-tetracycline-proton antiporter-like MFS transporter
MEEYIITEKSRQNWVIAIVTASAFMFSLDYSMLNISLPTIADYFHVNLGSVARLPMAYLLIVTSSLLAFGRLGDIRGYKKIFIAGLVIFAVGTFSCAFSPNINVLLALRAFQSVGEAMFSPVGMAIVTSCLPDSIKGRSLGILATAQGLGIAVGSFLGGFINAHLTWHAIFFVNIPLVIATIVLSMKFLPEKQASVPDKRFDIAGTILIFFALSSLVYAMNILGKIGVSASFILAAFIFSLVSFTLFIIWEKKITYPLLDLSFFRNPNFGFANVAAFFGTFILIGFGFLAPFYLELARGLNVAQSGVFFAVPALTMMILAPISGKMADRVGSRYLCCLGMGVSASAFAVLSLMGQNSGTIYVLLSLFLIGAGAGIFLPPNNKLVMASAPFDKQGAASGVYKIFLSTGSVFGIAIFPIVITNISVFLASKANIAGAEIRHTPSILHAGFRGGFAFGILVCMAAFIFSFLAKDKNTGGD